MFTDLTSLGAPPNPPPPPIAPLSSLDELQPVRVFMSGGISPNMQTSLLAPGESDALASAPYRERRRHLQSQDADGEGAEILDATDDPLIIAACSTAEAGNLLSLCETNGYENAVR